MPYRFFLDGNKMTLISLLIVFALEFHFKIGSEYRNFSWFNKIQQYLSDRFSENDFFESWGGIAIILLSPLALLYGALNLFDGSLFWLLSLAISIAILFLCLGPLPLEKSFEHYFKAVENDDLEAAYLHLNRVGSSNEINKGDEITGNVDIEQDDYSRQDEIGQNSPDIAEKDELIRNATRKILTESQKRYFGVIAWFIVLGPLGALFYRLSYLYHAHCKTAEFDEHLPLMDQIIHWIEWVPARITSMLFLLTGDFVNGFYRIQDYLTDADADNNQLISETGIASLGLEMGINDGDVNENHRTMALVNRTIIFYLVLGAVISTIF